MTSPPQGPGQEGSDEPREPSDDQPQGGTSGEPQDGSAAAAGESGSDEQSSASTGQPGEQSAADAEETVVVPNAAAQNSSAQQGGGLGEPADGSAGKKKSKKPMVIIGVVVLVVVLAGAGAAAWVFLGGKSAQQAAERYVELSTRETQDPKSVKADDYREVVCSQAMPQIEQVQQEKDQFLQQASPQDLDQLKQVKTTLKGVEENGETGKATIETSMPEAPPQSVDLKLMKEEGDWKLCG